MSELQSRQSAQDRESISIPLQLRIVAGLISITLVWFVFLPILQLAAAASSQS